MAKRVQSGTQLPLLPDVLYDPRFLEAHAGTRILNDPKTAVVELIANAWDAGATEVLITWPDGQHISDFEISDNGVGMTHEEFDRRWRKLSYNRLQEQGDRVTFPARSGAHTRDRAAFGRNGVGRWAGFCFSDSYRVDTAANGLRNCYVVARASEKPFEITRVSADEAASDSGTTINCRVVRNLSLSPAEARAEIGMRFLTDPDFQVLVNDERVDFEDISGSNIAVLHLDVGDGTTVELIVIDTRETDRTTKQHGVAWHVLGRLVGSCTWKGAGADDLIDGRRIAAKRFTFIVRADALAEADAVLKDWSGFDPENKRFQATADVVYSKVREHLLAASEEDRKETLARAREQNREALQILSPMGVEKWESFVAEAQQKCPSIRDGDIVKLSEIVANLELSRSGYLLLHKLSEYGPDQLDELHELLSEWTLGMAKAVLDEIGKRMKLVAELEIRVADTRTNELHDLQPLFENGLWIFGPEFETIEYTSNAGMTRVVQELFGLSGVTMSRNRPDFVILPDGSAGLYSYPSYDSEGGEIGTDRLVVVELKRPGVTVGEAQKAQCWRYLKELYGKGLLQERSTRVRCFVLGSQVDPLENSARKEMEETVEIQPLLFATVLQRAHSRLLNLKQRVQDAPFLAEHKAEIEAYLAPPVAERTLFDSVDP